MNNTKLSSLSNILQYSRNKTDYNIFFYFLFNNLAERFEQIVIAISFCQMLIEQYIFICKSVFWARVYNYNIQHRLERQMIYDDRAIYYA